jgi:hypothetical protein
MSQTTVLSPILVNVMEDLIIDAKLQYLICMLKSSSSQKKIMKLRPSSYIFSLPLNFLFSRGENRVVRERVGRSKLSQSIASSVIFHLLVDGKKRAMSVPSEHDKC